MVLPAMLLTAVGTEDDWVCSKCVSNVDVQRDYAINVNQVQQLAPRYGNRACAPPGHVPPRSSAPPTFFRKPGQMHTRSKAVPILSLWKTLTSRWRSIVSYVLVFTNTVMYIKKIKKKQEITLARAAWVVFQKCEKFVWRRQHDIRPRDNHKSQVCHVGCQFKPTLYLAPDITPQREFWGRDLDLWWRLGSRDVISHVTIGFANAIAL